MDTFINALKAAEKVTTKKEKFEALSGLSEIGKRFMLEGLSAYRVFGVKKFPMPKSYYSYDAHPDVFLELLDKLHKRELTGNAAINAVTHSLSLYTEETAKYLARVIDKDFKAGFSETTLNKIYPNLVPTYDVMLAFPIPMEGEEKPKKFDWDSGPWFCQIKYDGRRVNAPTSKKEGTKYISRSGKDATDLEGLFDEEFQKLMDYVGTDIMPDGEAMGADFTESMNAKKKGNQKAKDNLFFYLFDIMTMSEWNNECCIATQSERIQFIEKACRELNLKKIVPPITKLCRTKEEVEAFYEEVLAMGQEGIMIKTVHGKYEWKRSENWWKWKPVRTFDATIVGFKPGTKGTKNEGSLGALEVEGVTEEGIEFTADIGTGFNPDKEMRDEIWNNKNKYMGMGVEFKGDPRLTLADGAKKHSVRWPRKPTFQFKKFRNDK